MQHSWLTFIAQLDRLGKNAVRFGMVVVFIWIGSLKFFTYEADGIVPFVANSPFLSFFYQHPSEYKKHMNKEGELMESNHKWHQENGTYIFSQVLGAFIILLGVLLASYKILPFLSMIASLLIFLMTLGTLSFLITTPESWVSHINDHQWGFPYLSGRGRLVIKDIVILGGSILTMAESARMVINRKKN